LKKVEILPRIYYYIFFTPLFLIVFSSQLLAQGKFTDDLKLVLNYHTGYNLPEYQMFTYFTEDYVRSVDFSVVKETRGKNEWEHLYNFPEYGISVFYSTLGNDAVFGREISLNPFFKINIIYRPKFQLYTHLGVGLSYVNKVFDSELNYANVAIGSHVNLHFNFRLGMNYSLSEKIKWNLGLSFDHFSNANTHEPNLGINYLTAFTGLSYRIGKATEKQTLTIPPHVRRNIFELVYSIGGKYSRALSSKKYITSSISFDAQRAYFRAFYLGLGADIFFDASVKDQLQDTNREYRTKDSFQTGIHLSQTFVYDKLSITIQEGVYLLLTEQVEGNIIYNRGILRYQMTDKFSVRLSMKSHLHILDYPELGFGYKF